MDLPPETLPTSDSGLPSLDRPCLAEWLRTKVGLEAPLRFSRLTGGQSNPTYRIDCAGGTFVLRRQPAGPLLASAHAVDREYRVMSALGRVGFPVPQVRALCEDTALLGAKFYVMDFVAGRTLWGIAPGLAPGERRDIYRQLIATLAALHNLSPQAIGLGDYGRSGQFLVRQVARWTKQYRASQTRHVEAMELLIDWLGGTIPPQDPRTCIVHGDFRLDNLVFASGGTTVNAVLDWELSTLGDPLADLSYLLMNWVAPAGATAADSGFADQDFAALGIPSLEACLGQYCALTGRTALPDLAWYFAFNLFRLAAIFQGIAKRIETGNAASADAATYAARVDAAASAAWAHVRLARHQS